MGLLSLMKALMHPKKAAEGIKEQYKTYQDTTVPVAYMTGAQLALKHYDKYRRLSFWVWFCGVFVCLFIGQYSLMIIFMMLLHTQIMFNQLWWKLIHLEKKYEKNATD